MFAFRVIFLSCLCELYIAAQMYIQMKFTVVKSQILVMTLSQHMQYQHFDTKCTFPIVFFYIYIFNENSVLQIKTDLISLLLSEAS